MTYLESSQRSLSIAKVDTKHHTRRGLLRHVFSSSLHTRGHPHVAGVAIAVGVARWV